MIRYWRNGSYVLGRSSIWTCRILHICWIFSSILASKVKIPHVQIDERPRALVWVCFSKQTKNKSSTAHTTKTIIILNPNRKFCKMYNNLKFWQKKNGSVMQNHELGIHSDKIWSDRTAQNMRYLKKPIGCLYFVHNELGVNICPYSSRFLVEQSQKIKRFREGFWWFEVPEIFNISKFTRF